MKHLSLFSGIGGFDLAAEWMGWENMAYCEINPFCRKILNYYWPKAISYEDIKTTDFTIWRGIIDIVTGGFPCQPFSVAGARKGTEDDRHLWPEMLRAIREIQPSFVVGENVNGITNWNDGMVFEQVQIDLEAEGYEVQPVVLPACAVGADHLRERVWVIGFKKTYDPNGFSIRLRNKGNGTRDTIFISENNERNYREKFTTESIICNRDDGIFKRLDATSVFNGARKGRNTFNKWRNESIKAAGNAIVPQVAYQIFKAIEATL